MSTAPTRYDVFLSHNSADYFAAAALEQRLARAGVRPWLTASQLIPGKPWQEAMEAALAQSEAVAVIIGPQGMGPWHNEQMRVAIDDAVQQGKGVIPVLLPGADPERINPFLKRRTWVDFRGGLENEAAFQLLLAGIRGQAPFEAGDLFGLAWARRKDFYRQIPYPTNFVPRPELLAEVRQALLTGTAALALTSAIKMDALHGMGGIGKSVMARALCDDPEVQAVFPDGILWTTLGQTPELIPRLREWIDTLGGTVSEIAPTVDRLKAILADLLRDRACLLIVDDAWRKAHAEAFRVGGPRCRLFLTTRDAALAADLGAMVHTVPVMTEPEAVELLEEWAMGDLQGAEPELKGKIVRRLGRLPLAIKLTGAQLQRQEAEQWLTSFDVRKLKARRMEDEHDSLVATFGLSLDDLGPADRQLYAALAIFREDEVIPVVGIARLWSTLDGRAGDEARELLDDLAARALVERSQADGDAIRIHDLLRDFLAAELGGEGRIAAHRALLDAYRATQEGDGWHTAPDDGYLYNHLAFHLNQLADHGTQFESELCGLFAAQEWLHRRVPQSSYLYDGYLEDLDIAWTRVYHTTQGQINDDKDPKSLAESVRYALIHTTINSLANNYVPDLVAQAVESGLWTTERALGVARRATSPNSRAALYTGLIRTKRLPNKDRMDAAIHALEAACGIEGEYTRVENLTDLATMLTGELRRRALAQALETTLEIQDRVYSTDFLIRLVPYLSGRLLRQALENVMSLQSGGYLAYVLRYVNRSQLSKALVKQLLTFSLAAEDDYSKGRILAYLAPKLDGHLVELAMSAARTLDERSRPYVLCAYAERRSGASRERVLEEALEAARSIPQEGERSQALAFVARSLSGAPRAQVLGEALSAALDIENEHFRLSILSNLTPNLPEELMRRSIECFLSTVMTVESEQRRTEFLLRMVPWSDWYSLEGQQMYHPIGAENSGLRWNSSRKEWLEQVFTVALTITDQTDKSCALAAMIPQLSGALRETALDHWLATTLAIGDGSKRLAALSQLIPELPPKLKKQVIDHARVTAFSISNTEDRAQSLVALSPYLSEEPLRRTLEIVFTIRDSAKREKLLANLARWLPRDLLKQALTDNLALEDEDDVAGSLVGLLQMLPAKDRDRVKQSILTAVLAISNQSLRARRVTSLALHLPEVLNARILEDVLTSALGIDDEYERSRVIAHLAPGLPEAMLENALKASLAMDLPYRRAKAVASLTAQSQCDLFKRALKQEVASAFRIEDDWTRALTLAELAPALLGRSKRRALRESVTTAQAVQESYRDSILETLAPQVAGDLLAKVLRATLERPKRQQARVLVKLAPKLTGRSLDQGLTAALMLTRESDRSRVLAALAPQLTHELLSKALAAALELTNEWDRSRAICALAPRLAGDLLDQGLRAVMTMSMEEPRAQALSCLAPKLTGERLDIGFTLALDFQSAKALTSTTVSFLPYASDSAGWLRHIRHATNDRLFLIQSSRDRADLLDFLSSRKLFTPPILSSENLAAIASHIVEICQEWEWL